jgi:hypothetical protein
MAFFFRPYPTISYRIPGSTLSVAATDITRRFSVANFVRNSSVTFDEYYIQDGDRPDTVAYDYYDDQTLDWLVLLTNEIHDPYYEWPLSYEQFRSYLRQKYTSVEYALSNVHHYEQILQEQQNIVENGFQRIIPEKTLVVDYTTYLSLTAPQRKIVSIFDHENKINEERKQIYLIDLNYLQIIKDDHPYIFEEGISVR